MQDFILLFTFLAMDSFAQTHYIEAKMNETNEIELFYLDTKALCVLFGRGSIIEENKVTVFENKL